MALSESTCSEIVTIPGFGSFASGEVAGAEGWFAAVGLPAGPWLCVWAAASLPSVSGRDAAGSLDGAAGPAALAEGAAGAEGLDG
jgi:hypothetical protein